MPAAGGGAGCGRRAGPRSRAGPATAGGGACGARGPRQHAGPAAVGGGACDGPWRRAKPARWQGAGAGGAREDLGREEGEGGREREEVRVWLDPKVIVVCTNLKH